MHPRRTVAILTLMAHLLPLVYLSGLAAGPSPAAVAPSSNATQSEGGILFLDNAYRRGFLPITRRAN
jgi:hypothetical protein